MQDNNKTISCTVKQEEEGRLVITNILYQRENSILLNSRTHFTKTFMFKLSVTEPPTSAQRNEILIKEISFLSSIIVALAFFILLGVLFCISKYRAGGHKMPPNLSGATLDEMDAIFGNFCDQPAGLVRPAAPGPIMK